MSHLCYTLRWLNVGQCFQNAIERKEAVKVKLKQLLEGISYEVQQGNVEMEISDFQYYSRKLEKDSLFVCIT